MMNDQFASNAFAVHANYTASGKSILASDPHLTGLLPTNWYMIGLHWNDTQIIGASVPGTMYIGQGRTKHFAFGQTAPLNDLSDLYKETIGGSGTLYMVDNEWREIKIINEEIIVKGQNRPVKYEVKLTHRGALMGKDDFPAAALLFGAMPKLSTDNFYSLQWSGAVDYENGISFFRGF